MFLGHLIHVLFLLVFLSPFYKATAASLSGRQNDTQPPFATFIYENELDGNFIFSIRAVSTTGDIFFHVSGPAEYQWIAVGTGREMEGSVMWVTYPNAKGDGLTLSPRLSTGNYEPTYSKDLPCEIADGPDMRSGIGKDEFNQATFEMNVHCRNITAFGKKDGRLDFSRDKQPFVFAVGMINWSLNSDNPAADLRRHAAYGSFSVDMTRATVNSPEGVRVPSGEALVRSENSELYGVKGDSHTSSPFHAALMCGSFLFIFPVGVLALRVLNRVNTHALIQGVGLLAVVTGVGTGLFLSRMYNRAKKVDSAHQIFGLVIFFFVLIQWALGLYHHRQYAKFQRPTIFGRIHLYAGPVVLCAGLVNGFLGFTFISAPKYNIFYGILVVLMAAVVGGLLLWKKRRTAVLEKRARALQQQQPARPPFQQSQQQQQQQSPYARGPEESIGGPSVRSSQASMGEPYGYHESRSDIALREMPPAYEERPVQPRSMV